jgi:hypothetical protein
MDWEQPFWMKKTCAATQHEALEISDLTGGRQGPLFPTRLQESRASNKFPTNLAGLMSYIRVVDVQ